MYLIYPGSQTIYGPYNSIRVKQHGNILVMIAEINENDDIVFPLVEEVKVYQDWLALTESKKQ